MYIPKGVGLNKKTLLIAGVVVLALLLGGIAIFNQRSKDDAAQSGMVKYVPVAASGIVYPAEWSEADEITESEKESGVTSIATKDSPTTRVIVREVPGELAADFDITKLPDQIVSGLEAEIEGFTLGSKDTLKYGSHDAVKIEYSQLSPADQKIYQFIMFIVPTSKKTYYITYTSDSDIAKIKDDVTKINQALVTHIKSSK